MCVWGLCGAQRAPSLCAPHVEWELQIQVPWPDLADQLREQRGPGPCWNTPSQSSQRQGQPGFSGKDVPLVSVLCVPGARGAEAQVPRKFNPEKSVTPHPGPAARHQLPTRLSLPTCPGGAPWQALPPEACHPPHQGSTFPGNFCFCLRRQRDLGRKGLPCRPRTGVTAAPAPRKHFLSR